MRPPTRRASLLFLFLFLPGHLSGQTVTDTIVATADASVASMPEYRNNNFGLPNQSFEALTSRLAVGADASTWAPDIVSPGVYASLLRFDLSGLAGKTLVSAELKLRASTKVNSSSNRGIGLFTLSSSWSESSVTWANMPSMVESNPLVEFGHGSCWTCRLDVTSTVAAWAGGSKANYGFMLFSQDAALYQDWTIGFQSRHASAANDRPMLIVTYEAALPLPPDPRLDLFTIDPDPVVAGDGTAVIRVEGSNHGGSADPGGISVSFADLVGTGDDGLVSVTCSDSGTGREYPKGYDPIYRKDGTTRVAGYLLTECTWDTWPPSGSRWMEVRFSPEVAKTYSVGSRVTLRRAGDDQWWNAPGSGPLDQQDWSVSVKTVVASEAKGSLSVEVFEADGAAMSGSELNALLIYRDGVELTGLKVDPASNSHTWNDLDAGSYRVDAYANDMFVGSLSKEVVAASTASGSIDAPARAALAVRVYYSDGQTPLEDARVELLSHDEIIWRVGMAVPDLYFVDWDPSGAVKDTVWPLPDRQQDEKWFAVVLRGGQEVGRLELDLAPSERRTAHVVTGVQVPSTSPPVPVITAFDVSPTSGEPGDLVTVTVRVRNDGGDARPGGVTITVPELQSIDADAMIANSEAPGGRWLMRTSREGDLIYHRDDGIGQFQNQYLFADWEVPFWGAGQEKEVRLTVRLPDYTEAITIQARSALREADVATYVNAPSDVEPGAGFDLQGWGVLTQPVSVSSVLTCDVFEFRQVAGTGEGSKALVLIHGLQPEYLRDLDDYQQECAAWDFSDQQLSGWDPIFSEASVLESYDVFLFNYFPLAPADESSIRLAGELGALADQYSDVVLVGHSNGGIVARGALDKQPSLQASVEKIITLGTPHGGALTLGLNPAVIDVNLLSPYLAHLNNQSTVDWENMLYTFAGSLRGSLFQIWENVNVGDLLYLPGAALNDQFFEKMIDLGLVPTDPMFWQSADQRRLWRHSDGVVSVSSALPPFSRQQRANPDDLGWSPNVSHSDVRESLSSDHAAAVRRLLLPGLLGPSQNQDITVEPGAELDIRFAENPSANSTVVAWRIRLSDGTPGEPTEVMLGSMPFRVPTQWLTAGRSVTVRARPVYAFDDGDADEDGDAAEVKADGTWSIPIRIEVEQSPPTIQVSETVVELGETFDVSWTEILGASQYLLEWSDFLDFSEVRGSETTSETASSQAIAAEDGVTQRHFRVKADNGPFSDPVTVSIVPYHTLTIEGRGIGDGYVRSSEAEPLLDCLIVDGEGSPHTGNCTYDFPEDAEVTLIPDPQPEGATFGDWEGACSGSAGCTLTMTEAKTVSARFLTPPRIDVSVDTLRLSATEGSGTPGTGTARITNTGETPLTGLGVSDVTYLGVGAGTWLQASLAATTAPTDVQASASPSGLSSGRYVAEVTLTATSAPGHESVLPVVFTVSEVAVASVTISPDGGTIEVGETLQLSAVARDASDQQLDRSFSWTSLGATVASVDASGGVQGLTEGSARIVADVQGVADTVTVTVNPVPPPPVATVVISPALDTLDIGESRSFDVVLKDGAGNELTGRPVTWTSLKTDVAQADGALVTAIARGTAAIVASVEGVADTATVVVTSSVRDLPAWVEGLVARHGDTVIVRSFVDLSVTGAGIGSIVASMEFDPGVLELISATQGDLSASATIKVDSAGFGLVRIGGINTNSGVNQDTTEFLMLRFLVVGAFGSLSPLDLTMAELGTVDFQDLTSRLATRDAEAVVTPGEIGFALVGEPDVSRQESRPIDLRAYLTDVDAAIGTLDARVHFGPTVLMVDSVTDGSFGGTVSSELSQQAVSGWVRVVVTGSAGPVFDSVTMARIWVTGTGEGGESTAVSTELRQLAATGGGVDLLPFVAQNHGTTVTVRTGLWGDPTGDKTISAVDALVCLSHVVGKDVSQFETAACDVAPDGANNTFTGQVKAVDALAILSHVVGKALPEHFRVGDAR